MKIVTVVGNRPQFVKLGVTARALRALGDAAPFRSVVVNTGQHYDSLLSDIFFAELEIEAPDYQLGVGSGPIVDQIGKILPSLREIFASERPDGVLVYGDTNSTLAAAVAAAHADIPLFHVEGGERLYRRAQMPEEINRVGTDHLSDLCLCSSRKAVRYLKREGFNDRRAIFVGDPMLDIFRLTGRMIEQRGEGGARALGLEPGGFILATIHRAENTDEPAIATAILGALDAAPMPVLLPVHPRLRDRLQGWGWSPAGSLRLIEPLGYFDFQALLRECALVVSDSGGVNRESFFAGKPCIVPLDNFAWIEAAEAGFSVAVGQDAERLGALLHGFRPSGDPSAIVAREFGDGDAGRHIIEEVARYVAGGRQNGEGAWHPLGHYQDVPASADRSGYALDRLRTALAALAARGVRWLTDEDAMTAAQAGDVVLAHRVRDDLAAARALAAVEAATGAKGLYFLDPFAASYNPWSPEAAEAIRGIVADGHALGIEAEPGSPADQISACASIWARRFGADVRFVRGGDAPGLVRFEQAAQRIAPADLDAATSGDGPALVDLTADDWAEVPVMPAEASLRALDDIRDRRIAELVGRLGN